jgi:hypothetical protein
MSKPEKGAASLRIELSDSVIEVYHEDGTQLGVGRVREGDWDRLLSFLKDDLDLTWATK